MKFFLIILASFFVTLFAGCYTQLVTERDESSLTGPQESGDTVSYFYFPQNHLVPIHGWAPAVESPITPPTEESAPEPQDDEPWQVIWYPADRFEDPGPRTADPVGRPEPPHQPVSTQQAAPAKQKPSAASPASPVTNVRRTSGVQRTGVQNATASSPQDTTRNSGTTRRGGR